MFPSAVLHGKHVDHKIMKDVKFETKTILGQIMFNHANILIFFDISFSVKSAIYE